MKLLKKQISAKDGSGMVLLRPDTPEDLWHSYNLLQVGDRIRCSTHRKIVKESTTGSVTSTKRRLMLTVALQKIDFDPASLQVRISGTVEAENDFCPLGSHHTVTLELNQNFSIEKTCWDQVYLDVLDEATHPERQAEVAAVVMQGSGLAHLCLITGALTITKARIEVNIPKKRAGSTNHAKSTTRFYEAIYQAIMRHIDFAKVRCVLLASPGFVATEFWEYAKQQAVRRDDRTIIENRGKFILCKASSGHKHALEEVFGDPNIAAQMTDTKVSKEVQVLGKFMRLMDVDPDKAYYGYDHVVKAHQQLAIDSLLVTDELFRASDVKTRKRYVQLVEGVRQNGGQTYVFSSMHVSGQQLQQVSGVAAILRYPLPDLDELEEIAEGHKDGTTMVTNNDESMVNNSNYDPEARIREDMKDMGM